MNLPKTQKKVKEPKLPLNKQMFDQQDQQEESYAKVTEGVAFLKREKEKKKSKLRISNTERRW